MPPERQQLARRYATVLRKYLSNEQEAILADAYELGRRAISRGLGVLEMSRIHQDALQDILRTVGDEPCRAVRSAKTFLFESLSPFEATHRGFRETNLHLQELIKTLEKRNLELAAMNEDLESEIQERKRTERALRESEGHYRELFEEARRMEENLRNLSNQVLHAQEEERKRISRELHDQVGQALTAVSVTLATLKSDDAGLAERMGARVTDAQNLIRETMETVHSFARELRPTMLDELGLLPALRSYLNGFSNRTKLAVRFQGDPEAETLGPDQKTVLFRVAQESLTNVAKHAHATQVALSVRQRGKKVVMEVADNGKSFKVDPRQTAAGKKRLGLLGMQERVRLVSGQFDILARPGQGTTIRVTVPLQPPSALPKASSTRMGGRSRPALSRNTVQQPNPK